MRNLRTGRILKGVLFLLGLLTAGCAASLPPAEEARGPEALIRAARLLEDVTRLTAPEMEGRAVGGAGIERAAEFIAGRFQDAGLAPGGDGGTFLQRFAVVTGVRMGPDTALVAGGVSWTAGRDFVPFGFSAEGTAGGEVAFAGYGITAPELGYDDYADLDARGRIVLVMTHEPRERDAQSVFRRPEAFRYTEVRYKIINAREHGARGILVVADPLGHEGEAEHLFALKGLAATAPLGLPAANVTRRVAAALLTPSGRRLEDLQREIDVHLSPPWSFPVPGPGATLSVDLVRERGTAANVVGILRGRDPALRGTAAVVGAHYDHPGFGGETSLAPSRIGEVHPGADDNASGVAAVMAVARALRTRPAELRRTVVFVAFAGEELGLLGSAHYAGHPVVPMDRTVAMINLDMVGRLRNGRAYLQGVGTAREFRALVEEAAGGLGLHLEMSPGGFGPSDHTPFYAKDRPILFLFTGPHGDYHWPSDTPDKIHAEGLEGMARLTYRLTERLADRPEGLTFVRVQEPAASGPGRGGGYGPYFGSVPDFSSQGEGGGVRLLDVRAGSPAERAGLRAGDTIVRFGGTEVRTLDDLVYALRRHRAGEAVEVLFLRDGQVRRATAVLEERR